MEVLLKKDEGFEKVGELINPYKCCDLEVEAKKVDGN
jgi:hypothetical protein